MIVMQYQCVLCCKIDNSIMQAYKCLMLQLVIVFYGSRNYAGKLLPASTVVGKENCSVGMGFLQPVQIRRNLERGVGREKYGRWCQQHFRVVRDVALFFLLKTDRGDNNEQIGKDVARG